PNQPLLPRPQDRAAERARIGTNDRNHGRGSVCAHEVKIMQRLLLLGLNHTTAPLDVREKLAFNTSQRREALASFRSSYPGCEAVLLSTCNRVELYVARHLHGHPREEE